MAAITQLRTFGAMTGMPYGDFSGKTTQTFTGDPGSLFEAQPVWMHRHHFPPTGSSCGHRHHMSFVGAVLEYLTPARPAGV